MNKLFAKLLRSYVLVLLTAIMTTFGVLSYFYTETLFNQREEELVENGLRIAHAFEESFLPTQSIILLDTRINAIAGTLKAHITIANREGLITMTTVDETETENMIVLSPEDVRNVLDEGVILTRRGYEEAVREQVVTALVPIRVRGSVVGAVILHAPMSETLKALGTASRLLLIAVAIAAAAGVLISYVFSKRITAPIIDMTTASEEMARGQFDRRVQVRDGAAEEIIALGSAFNRLGSQLGETIDALMKETRKTESILVSMSEGVLAVDLSGKVILTNPAVADFLNVEHPLYSKFLEDESATAPLRHAFRHVLQGENDVSTELHIDDRTLVVQVSPLTNADGKLSGAVGILRDISEKERLERMRRHFLADISHELKTPLTSIRGFAQAILDGVIIGEQQMRRYVHVIMDESLRLIRLVNTLLDLSRIESHALQLHFERLDLEELITDTLEVLTPIISERQLDIALDIPPLPSVKADRDRLTQVWLNLLDNAARHAEKDGAVSISGEIVTIGDHERVVINIENDGSTIPENELPYIWERFYKIDKARRFERGVGTGLGLVIVKEIVELHGGTVRAENLAEGGVRFQVELPVNN